MTDRQLYPPVHVRRAPSAFTAVTAGVLALLGGLHHGVIGLLVLPSINDLIVSDPEFDPTGYWTKIKVLIMIEPAFGIPLLVGGVIMLRRKRIARVLIGVGGLGVLILSITATVSSYYHVAPQGTPVLLDSPATAFALAGTAFNVTMLALTFLPSTSRWLAHRP
ncbi:hypothetical protein JMUB6875_40620 [Nocardia sp. JMUB6875]|uniref:hypothetical protein n=1 Tax=Nocardia sp. JMUB6875 TaxID=3158170 RepID=UPI0032E5CC1D